MVASRHFILKILLNQRKWKVKFVTAWILSDVNYLSQSPWGSLLESPWTDLTWISSPNRSCSIWRDTPVRTCGGNKYLPALWPPTQVNKLHSASNLASSNKRVHMERALCDVLSWSLAYKPLSHVCFQQFTVKASSHRLLMALMLTGEPDRRVEWSRAQPLHKQLIGVVKVSAHTPRNDIHFNTQGWDAYLFRQECGFGRWVKELLADIQQCRSEAASLVNPLLSSNDAAVCRRTLRDQEPINQSEITQRRVCNPSSGGMRVNT